MHRSCYFMHLFACYAKLLHDFRGFSRMHKTKRQQKILSLIRARRIGTQQELSAMLERAGFVATQSSISRDLVELGVVKHQRVVALVLDAAQLQELSAMLERPGFVRR